MSLELISIPRDDEPIPQDVQDYFRDASERIDRFIRSRLDRPLTGFVPSDHARVYRALRTLRHSDFVSGPMFCEWGAGFAVVAGMASMLGFEVVAIEVEPELCEGAETLMSDWDLGVEVVCASFLPSGTEHLADMVDGPEWLVTWAPPAYEDLQLEPEDFDLTFAYPWPGEEGAIEALFDHCGGDGGLLLTYRGQEDLHLHRRTGRPPRR